LLAHIGCTTDQQLAVVAGPETVIRDVRCQTHHRSGLACMIGKRLGDDIGAYDGAWPDWSSNPELPVECL